MHWTTTRRALEDEYNYRSFSTTTTTSLKATIEDPSMTTTTTETSPNDSLESTSSSLLHPSDFQKKKKKKKKATNATQEEEEQQLLIPYPKSLSPSAILEFKSCPQSFLFQYLWGIKSPKNKILAKGSMCHEALEQIFDLPQKDRTLSNLQNLFRVVWSKNRKTEQYKHLFMNDDNHDNNADDNNWNYEDERIWGLESLQLLQNYVKVEDPSQVQKPNPVKREMWISAKLPIDSTKGVTAPMTMERIEMEEEEEEDNKEEEPSFLVRGIIDRLDLVRTLQTDDVVLRLVDYKSGKSPPLNKYPAKKTKEILENAFYQLKVYALLLRESKSKKNGLDNNNNKVDVDLRMLRLFHLTSTPEEDDGNKNSSNKAMILDYDLGATKQERDEKLWEIHQDISNVWTSIQTLVQTQDPTQFVGCNRSFCYCHVCRTKFIKGTVWEPEEATASSSDTAGGGGGGVAP